ncbi:MULTISPECIES: Xaa-Pro peptidase family protein [unclassified Chelatococcus]|uniref:M24 family metallopeptidase n=1 Tax=unclassified Chelatococcus TaxID=2638111 RepID=UPI0002DE5E8D|nr:MULTISPECIES: Xaa-Pro peptidase family protein [unclassified Chelatococcus]ALA18512.1 peptidase M24 [Chelatococcus sp. CO-6]
MLLNEARLTACMKRDDLAAVVATAPENVTYTSGFWAMTQWIRRGPQAYALWPVAGHGEPVIVASTATLDLVADQDAWVERVRRFGDFSVVSDEGELDPTSARQRALHELPDDGDALSALVAAITDAGLARARIGVDELGLLPGYWDRLQKRLPAATLVPAASLLRKVRAVKTEEEVARLRRAAEIAERSIAAALAIAREGVTELELARAFHTRTVEDDALPVLGCIGFGPRSALMNVQPSERRLAHGDVIRFDVGGRYCHYRADIARIATLGEPDAEILRCHRALLAGVERACEIIRPGVRAATVFEVTVETVRRSGIPDYARNHVGHGIGLDGYDAPDLSPGSPDVIEEGMVLCVETPYYVLGRWGLQVEDMVVVRADGVESLMTTAGDIRVVG